MRRMEGQPALASEECFMANLKTHSAPPAEANCDDLVASMLGRHCAGMSKRAGARELRLALTAKAGEAHGAAETIRWLLGSIWVQDLHKLAWRCGIPVVRLAEHARHAGITNARLIRWLNQFSAP